MQIFNFSFYLSLFLFFNLIFFYFYFTKKYRKLEISLSKSNHLITQNIEYKDKIVHFLVHDISNSLISAIYHTEQLKQLTSDMQFNEKIAKIENSLETIKATLNYVRENEIQNLLNKKIIN